MISSSEHGGRRKLPYVFTEQGVSMLSSVLKSSIAVNVNINIIRAFVEMRKFMIHNPLILIDNYVDESVLNLFLKRKEGVAAEIYTANLTATLKTDLEKHNKQYSPIDIKVYRNAHDRFLIIDEKHVYHIGASLKDLGKKLFGFSKMEIDANVIIEKLKIKN